MLKRVMLYLKDLYTLTNQFSFAFNEKNKKIQWTCNFILLQKKKKKH